MNSAVMVVITFRGDAAELLSRYETAVSRFSAEHGRAADPLYAAAGESEAGDLVVVNVWPTDEDHERFGHHMRDGGLADAGLPLPLLEHVAVKRIGWGAGNLPSAGRSAASTTSSDPSAT